MTKGVAHEAVPEPLDAIPLGRIGLLAHLCRGLVQTFGLTPEGLGNRAGGGMCTLRQRLQRADILLQLLIQSLQFMPAAAGDLIQFTQQSAQ